MHTIVKVYIHRVNNSHILEFFSHKWKTILENNTTADLKFSIIGPKNCLIVLALQIFFRDFIIKGSSEVVDTRNITVKEVNVKLHVITNVI